MNEFDDVWTPRSTHILIADDTPADVEILKAVLARRLPHLSVHSVSDGEAALAFLRREEPYTDAPRPDLVLLDVAIPKVDGLTVLVELKHDTGLRSIHVVVVSGNEDPTIVDQVTAHPGVSFMRKPRNLGEYEEVARSFSDFWLRVALNPAAPGG